MPKEPSLALFRCQNCGRTSRADARMAVHLLPWKRRLPIEPNGLCRYCQGDRWTISVIYVQSGVDVAESVVGLGLAAMTGHGFIQRSTSSSRTEYPDVPAEVVAALNENPRDRLARVAQFARALERAKLKEQGGRECGTCGLLFVPRAGVAWAEKGYCSKVCLVQAEGVSEAAVPVDEPKAESELEPEPGLEPEPERSDCLSVQCTSGHRFDVQRSFSGLMRPCPVCGQKTQIP
jgi:hypothetical protein